MNCRSNTNFILGMALVLFAYPILALSEAFATYTSATITPATGTIYSTNTPISVNVNSGSDEFGGADVIITFSGNMSYVSAVKNSICSSFTVTPAGNTLDVECFYLGGARTYNGSLGTLYFRSTGTGSAAITITSTDPEVTTKVSGAYTLSESDLPETGALDSSSRTLIIGVSMIALGGIVLLLSPLNDRIVGNRLRNKKNMMEERI